MSCSFHCLAFLGVVYCVALVGCGPAGSATVPVRGTLTIDGQPADNLVITLAPIDTSLPIATGRVTNGSFEELYSGIDGAVGAAPGKYKVVLASGEESIEAAKSRYSGGGSNAAGGSASLPDYQTKVLPFSGKYSTSVTSDKEVEVTVGPNNLTIDVSSK